MTPPGSSPSPGSAPVSPSAADPAESAPSVRERSGRRETPARVVGIGSSAGGLKSLMAVLRTAPTVAGYCYVVAQHISPDFDSPLTELLARAGDLEVVTAEDGMRLRPDVVFVCPPGSDITVDHEALGLAKPPQDRFAHPRIDLLFVSLASTWGRSCTALVLSGSGLDGSEGIRAVSEAGGVVIAEDPVTAEFDSMPRAAIATGLVDVVAKHDQIGAEVGRSADVRPSDPGSVAATEDRAVIAEDAGAPASPEPSDSDVKIVVDQLRTVLGTDFSEYKPRTLARQIARRMSVVGVADIPTYRRLLASDEHEASALTSALLIKVTAFLRDPSAWSALEAVLREEWAGRDPGRLVRIWVPGCATGEEAHTVAMMAARVLGILERPDRRIKVFATDLAEDALDAARRGVYSAEGVAPLPDSWRDTWLRREGDGWAVVSGLRDAVVFAAHNVAVDPPFPGVDLVCFRNTLIYFQESLQHQALGMCHYALVPGGILFLGNSERIAPDDTRFEAVDTLHRIYRRTSDASGEHRAQRRTIRAAAAVAEPRERESLHDELIASFVPPSLLIDAHDDVIEVVGDVSQWCAVAVGPRSNHVVALVREDLRVPVLALIVRLREGGSEPVTLDVPTDSGPVRITARLLDPSGTAILAFGQADVDAADSLPPEGSFGDAGSGELAATRATLQSVIEDLSASNEELRALNEELQAAGEEAQSSSEELEAANEELSTLNQELQVRTADLMAAKAYLESIESAVSAGLLVVDDQGRITRFTAQTVRLFALIPSDIGRPLADIPTTAPVPGLAAMVEASSRAGKAVMADIVGAEHDFLLQARPYPSLPQGGPSSGGAVLIVTDVTELSRARRAAVRAAAQVAAITDSLEPVVWQRDSAGRLVFLSRSVESLLGLHRERVLADQSLLVAAIHPDDREQVALASAAAADRRSQEYRVLRSDGEVRWVRETVTTSDASPAVDSFTVGTLVDITSERRARDEAEGSSQTVHALMEVERLGVVLLDKDNRIVRANPAFAELASRPADELVGMPLDVFLEHPGVDPSHDGSVPWPEGVEAHYSRFVAGDGSTHIVSLERRPIAGRSGQSRTLITVQDATAMSKYANDLGTKVRIDAQTGVMARAHFLATIDRELRGARALGGTSAAIWVDLDDFKAINDTYGHSTGDTVLAEVADRLRTCARRADPVGRLGGDEFGVLVTGLESVEAAQVAAERILRILSEPIETASGSVFITASLGIAFAPDDGDKADALLHNADTAMYVAKGRGGDRLAYFNSSMDDNAKLRSEIRLGLSSAIREQSFCMHYQPILSLTTGATVAVEALVRWLRDGTPVAAAEFIAIAEESGLMHGIGQVGRNALAEDLRSWCADPLLAELPVAVNLSAAELGEAQFASSVLSWEPPGGFQRVLVEVTERSLVAGSGAALGALELLCRLGARVSIDDFGSGFSNLAMLERVNPAVIKIDRSLLLGAFESDRGTALLGAAVQMAHALGSLALVEGIETEEHAALVRDLGAEFGQGYLYARPMPAADFSVWLAGQVAPEPM